MLTNRPLLYSITISKNDGALTTIQRDETYTSTELFVADMLTLYKNSFLINSNAVYIVKDCRGEMAAESFLRMLSHPYVDRKRGNGPFYLSFIDLYAGQCGLR